MSKPRDLLRSLVRRAADTAVETANRTGGLDRMRKTLEHVKQRRFPIPANALTSAVAHLPGVESASITASEGALHVDVAYTSGAFLQARLVPTSVRFAPRGAKEISFRIEPEEAARGYRVTDVVGALGGVIALHLWQSAVAASRTERSVGGAIVDRDGADTFVVDLRTTPAAKALEKLGQAGMILEILEISELSVADGALMVHVRLPHLGL